MPLESFPAPGAGLRAGKAGLPLRRHVERRARLHLAVRQGRARHRRRHGPVRLLQPAGRPAHRHAYARRHLRAVPAILPHADAAELGRHRRRDARPLADHRQDAGPGPVRQLRLGHRRLQGDARARATSSPTRSRRASRTRSTRRSRSTASAPAASSTRRPPPPWRIEASPCCSSLAPIAARDPRSSSAAAARRTSPGLPTRQASTIAAWAEFLFVRTNPKGVHAERWNHAHGCQRWFNALRDTASDRILRPT